MKVLDDGKDFQTLVQADADIMAHMSVNEIQGVLSVRSYLKNVDEIFDRVFGRGSSEKQ